MKTDKREPGDQKGGGGKPAVSDVPDFRTGRGEHLPSDEDRQLPEVQDQAAAEHGVGKLLVGRQGQVPIHQDPRQLIFTVAMTKQCDLKYF